MSFNLGKFLIAFLICFNAGAQTPDPSDHDLLKQMPLKTKIGQMFMIGFQGKRIEEGLARSIKDIRPGALIIFGRNISSARQLSDLIHSAQEAAVSVSGVPLLVATDQEGGDVIRVKTTIPLPSPLAFGKSGTPELTEKAGEATGRLLKTLGINMNLAPVLDISDPRKKTFVGTRSYGRDPHLVANLGLRFATGLSNSGVLPTGKHFPGHGGVSEDSHLSTPEKDVSLETILKQDLVPFSKVQERLQDQWAIMLAHVAFPKLDPTGVPATFSKPIIQGLLREKVGFKGIVLTDDIAMAGADRIKEIDERVIRSIEAGVDMVLVPWNSRQQRRLVQAVEKAVLSGRIPEERINESVLRILKAKRKFAQEQGRSSTQQLRLALNNPDLKEIAETLLKNSFTQELEEEEKELQNYAADKPVLLFSSNVGFAVGFRNSHPKRRAVRFFKLDIDRPHDVNRIMRANPTAFGVFYMSGYQVGRLAAQIHEDVARRMLLVTVEAPGHLPNASSFRYIKAVYLRHPSLGSMVARRYFQTEQPELTIRAPASGESKKKTP